jgi:hypothetical protein
MISLSVVKFVKNSQSLQSSGFCCPSACPLFLLLQILTLPSIPPVATISPSEENLTSITESSWPVNKIGSNDSLWNGKLAENGSSDGIGGKGQKM